jgi:leucyl/phenylalanyl-tRNA--protein transferase
MSDIPWLSANNCAFPDPATALDDPEGLLAVGGDLSPERLVAAYRLGIFPWYEEPQPILWWTPSPRTVLFPEQVHISKSLKKRLHKKEFSVSIDQAFTDVIRLCAQVPRKGQGGTWIGSDMIQAYTELYRLGIAHSVEVWRDQQLVGGLYGLSIGKVFFGESMFSLATDASKVAFVRLARQLAEHDFALIDCQVANEHLFTLGCQEISRRQFSQLLHDNIDRPDTFFGQAKDT